MDFDTLFKRISPILRHIAKSIQVNDVTIDEEDLYQEMCKYVWERYADGLPIGINISYVINGCRFYIQNYLRKSYHRQRFQSLDELMTSENNEHSFSKIFPQDATSSERQSYYNKLSIEILLDRFTEKQRKVLFLLMKDYTSREIGKELGISHVMVLKFKK